MTDPERRHRALRMYICIDAECPHVGKDHTAHGAYRCATVGEFIGQARDHVNLLLDWALETIGPNGEYPREMAVRS